MACAQEYAKANPYGEDDGMVACYDTPKLRIRSSDYLDNTRVFDESYVPADHYLVVTFDVGDAMVDDLHYCIDDYGTVFAMAMID